MNLNLKQTINSLVEAEQFVALSIAKAASYVFTDISVNWDPKDHPRDPHTGEFMKTPSGYIFGKTKSASFNTGGGEKTLSLKPGDVAFKTPAGNVVVSHADGSYSLHHGSKIDTIPAGKQSTIAANVMDGHYQKIGENPGVHVNASTQAQAEDMLKNPASYGTGSKPAASGEKVKATDADMVVGNIVYKSATPGSVAWEVAAVGTGHSGGIGVSLKKPGSAGGTTNAQYISAHLYVQPGENAKTAPESPAAPSVTEAPATPLEAAHAGTQSAWEVPKPTLKPGKDKFTDKQYADYQNATKGLPMGPDSKGTPIKSGDWVEFEGKPLQVWASPYGKLDGFNSDFKVTAYRWVSTKQQASNLEKEDFVGLGDFGHMTVIPDPTGKPYGAPHPNSIAAGDIAEQKPKHGSLMSQAAIAAIPNTATAHKKHVADAKGVLLTDHPNSTELLKEGGGTHDYLIVKDAEGKHVALKSGDWVEIDSKPVQVHASPNAGNIAISKWVSTKQQASNNTYDFPESVLSGATKIPDPTGKPYTPLTTTAAPEPAAVPDAPAAPSAEATVSGPNQAVYEKHGGKWFYTVASDGTVLKSPVEITGPKIAELESKASPSSPPDAPAPALLDVLKQHMDDQKAKGEVTPDPWAITPTTESIKAMEPGDILYAKGANTGKESWYVKQTDGTFQSFNDTGAGSFGTEAQVLGGVENPSFILSHVKPADWQGDTSEAESSASLIKGTEVPDSLDPEPYSLSVHDMTEESMAALPAGTVVSNLADVHLHKDAHNLWSILNPDSSEWPTVSDAEAATTLANVMDAWDAATVLPAGSEGAAHVMDNPLNYPIQKQVNYNWENFTWQKDGWYSAEGIPQFGTSAEVLDDTYDTNAKVAADIMAMQPGDELHVTRKESGKVTVYKASMVAGVMAMENITTPSVNATGMNGPQHFAAWVHKPVFNKFNFQILAKGESTEDATPKQQQFVHPVSGLVFTLEPGDKVYKHKTTDNAFIIVKGSGDNPINFFTQTGTQQKPKANQKNLAKAYEVVDDWPGKVAEDKNGTVVQPDITPGQAPTLEAIKNASPGDTIHVYEKTGYHYNSYVKQESGAWTQDSTGLNFNQDFAEIAFSGSHEQFDYQFYPAGTTPPVAEHQDSSPWGSPDAAGTPQVDPEPITTAPAPKKSKKAKPTAPALPTVVTDPGGNQITLKVGESYAKVSGDHGEEVYVHVTQGGAANTLWGANSTSYHWDKKAYKFTQASVKTYIKANGGELIGENLAPPAEKIDFSDYNATTFVDSESSYPHSTISNYIETQKNQFPIDTYYGGGISYYKGYDQFDGKTWHNLDTQQKTSLIAQYEHIAGDAVASLEPVAKFDSLDKADKTAFGKTRSGFTTIHRAAVLAREIENPDTTWSNDKFSAELAFLSSKTNKPGVAFGSDLKNAFPVSDVFLALSAANQQRQFKASLTNLDFDPFNATTEEYDSYAKDKGFMHLAALTEAEQKAWVLGDLGDPTMSAATKQAALKAAELVKHKIAIADLAAHLESKQVDAGKPKVLNVAKGIYSKASLKASYSWSSTHGTFAITNQGDDSWVFADMGNGSTVQATDAEVLNLVNGALENGADMTSSPNSAYGSVTTKDNFDKLAIKHGVGVDKWSPVSVSQYKEIIGAEGGGVATIDSSLYGSGPTLERWLLYHAAGDEIGKYNVEKTINGGVHPHADTHPGSPTSPTGKAAHKALAELLSTSEAGQAWLNEGYLNSAQRQELENILGLTKADFHGTSYYDDFALWELGHDVADLKAMVPGSAASGSTTAIKPAVVPQESWTVVDGVDGATDLSALFPGDVGIGTLTDAELTANLANDSYASQSGLTPYIGSLPTHIKRLAVWSAGGDSNDKYRRGILLAVAAKAKAGEYMAADTPAWVAPNGAKYPMSPGAKVYSLSNYNGTHFIVTGPPKADGAASDQAWQYSAGSASPSKVSTWVAQSLGNDEDYTLLYTMPAPVQYDQAKKDIPDLTDAYWDEASLIEEGKSTMYTSSESGPILTAALKKNDDLKENYPHLYGQHKSLPENVRQAVLAALTGKYASPVLLQLLDYKASKGHYASMGTKGLFDASQPWLSNVSKGQFTESDVASKWTPQAKDAYVAHFGLSGHGDISTHLNALLNPETPVISKGLPNFTDLKLTKTGKTLGGMHSKQVLVDQDGNEWMSKAFNSDPNAKARVDAETGAVRVGHLFNFRTPAANTQAVPGYSYAYLQHLAPAKGDLSSKGPKDLSTKQLQQAMEEHLLDWITANHDTHSQNLMIDPNGNIFGIDKGQAFKHFPNDKLAVGYLPPENGAAVWYDQFYKALQNGQIDKETADEVTKHVLRRAQKIAKDRDEDYRAELETALANRTFWPSQFPTREAFIDGLVERKHNLFDDFLGLYKGMYAKSPYEWTIDEENLVPPKINEHTHIAVSTDLANDVHKAGIHGKALFFNSPDLTDSHVMFSKVTGPDKQPMLTGTARVREKSETALMDWLKKQTIQGHTAVQTQSYNDYDNSTVTTFDGAHLPGNSEWFNAMVGGSKTVSSHNASGNQDYNQTTLTNMDAAANQITVAQQELADWKAENPGVPFKGKIALAQGSMSPIDVELHTMEQQAAWESMLDTYAGYAQKVNDHKGSDQKISPHFQQVTYTPSKDAQDLVAAKNAAGKTMSPFLASKVEDILKKATNGDQITVTKDGTTTVYTKAYGGWKDGALGATDSPDFAALVQGTWKDASFAYSGTVPGVPNEGNVKTWANQQDSGAALTVLMSNGEYQMLTKNAEGTWDGGGDSIDANTIVYALKNEGWKIADGQTAEETAEKSATVQVGSKVLKVMYRKAASKAGKLSADGDLEMTNSEISNFDFGHMYEIDFGNTVIEYRPWEHSAGVAKAQKGVLKFRKKDWSEGDSNSLDEVLDVLRQIGLNLDPATEESMELFYWRHMTGTVRDRKEGKNGGAWNGIVKDVDAARAKNPNMTAVEETEVIKEAWAKVIGQDKVDRAQWQPQFSRNRVHVLEDAEDTFTSGRPYWLRPDLTASELKALYGNKYVASSLYHSGDALKIAMTGASLSSEERYRVLASGFQSGWSSTADATSHGSSGVLYTRQGRDLNWHSGYSEHVYYHPKVAMRSHNYAFNSDTFGDETAKLNSPYQPSTMMKQTSGGNEMLVKYSASVLDDIAVIHFASATDRNAAIKAYKDLGITTIHGLPIEQVFVMNRNDAKAVMDKLWADMIAEEKANA